MPRTAYPYWYFPVYDRRAEVRVQVTPLCGRSKQRQPCATAPLGVNDDEARCWPIYLIAIKAWPRAKTVA